MSPDNGNCNEPEIGRLVFRWAIVHGPKQRWPQDPRLQEHLERCTACRDSVMDWMRQSEATELLSEARRVVSGNLTSQDRVDEKKKENGERILFRSSLDNLFDGMLISVAADGRITSVSVANRRSFEEL